MITSEYAIRSITFSLQCVPERTRLLLGKAGIVASFGFVVATLLGVLGVSVTVPTLGEYGYFSAGDTVRTVLAIGLYSGLISIVAMGVGSLTRSSAATVSILFLLLLMASVLLGGPMMPRLQQDKQARCQPSFRWDLDGPSSAHRRPGPNRG